MFTFLRFDALTQVTCSYMLHVQSPPSMQTSIDPCTKDPRAKSGHTNPSTNLQLQDPRELVERVWLPVYKFEATVDNDSET